MLIPLGVTFYAWNTVSNYIHQRTQIEFQALAQESEKALLYRIESYEQGLLGGVGFFKGSQTVSRSEWKNYIDSLEINKKYPGINGIGYIANLSAQEQEHFVKEMRTTGKTDFSVFPATDIPEHFIIGYIEPQKLNEPSIGFNIASEPNRYAAATLSRDSGHTAMTHRVLLLQDETKQPGFLLLHPIYSSNSPLETTEQRRHAIRGWIFAPFIGSHFLHDLTKSQDSTLNLIVFDGSEGDTKNLIYNSEKLSDSLRPPLFSVQKKLNIMQQEWTVIWQSTPVFERKAKSHEPLIILISGLIFSGLLVWLVNNMMQRSEIIRRRVEDQTRELAANESKLKLLIQHTPAAVAMFDTHMRYIMASERWLKDYHLQGRHIMGESHYEIFPEILNIPGWAEEHQRVLKGEIIAREEDFFERLDGRADWIRWAMHPWRNAEGEINGIIMFTEVITERKEAELRDVLLREISLEAAVSSSSEGMIESVLARICIYLRWSLAHAYIWDDKKNVLKSSGIWYFHFNQEEFQKFREVSEEMTFAPGIGLPGRTLSARKPVFFQDVATDKNFLRSQLVPNMPIHAAVALPVFVGSKVVAVLEFFSTNTLSEEQNLASFLEVVSIQLSRVIERKQAEEALRTNEETFRSAMENASIGMAFVDLTGRFMKVNKALLDLLGFNEEELTGLHFQEITHPDDLEKDLAYVQQILNKEIRTYQMEKRYFRKDGGIIWILLNVSLVWSGDLPAYFIAQIQDITARKEMDRIKSEFISIVSHELRTPLTSIRGSLGLMAGAMASELSDKALHLINIAHKNSERLILLINDILDIEKIASGHMRFDMKVENLQKLLQQALDSNQSYGEKFKVSFRLEAPDKEFNVQADASRFAQVMSNLLSNAAKFSPEGEEVVISIVEGAHHTVRILVEDHGPGIPEEFQSRIFSKFSQADSSMTRQKGGTGLGLHISQQIIRNMNGDIGFHSEQGKGTTFWIEFPIHQSLFTELTYDACYRILIRTTEDDFRYLREIIGNAGFLAEHATTDEEVQPMLEKNLYAAIICYEWKQPDMSLPVIIYSGRKQEKGDKEEDKKAGIIARLTKPVEGEVLLSVLRDITNQGQLSSKLPRVLHVEDDADLSNVIATALYGKAEVIAAPTIREAELRLRQEHFDLLLLDIMMPDGSGLIILEHMKELMGRKIPTLILTAGDVPAEAQRLVEGIIIKSRMSESKIIEMILKLVEQDGVES